MGLIWRRAWGRKGRVSRSRCLKRSKRDTLGKTEKEGGLWQLESLLSLNALCDHWKYLSVSRVCHCNTQC